MGNVESGSPKYTIGGRIGYGATADVHKGTYNDVERAFKIFRGRRPRSSEREIETLKGMLHPNVIEFIDALRTDSGCDIIVMEYARGGTLSKALHGEMKFSMEQNFSIIHQIASGLAFLHSQGVIHRDIKPANILFKDTEKTRIVLADFGMADENDYRSYAGARMFRPPDGEQYGKKSDVYMMAGVACCVINNRNELENRGRNNMVSPSFELLRRRNESRYSEIYDALSPSKEERPSAAHFRDAFRDSYAMGNIALGLGLTASVVGLAAFFANN